MEKYALYRLYLNKAMIRDYRKYYGMQPCAAKNLCPYGEQHYAAKILYLHWKMVSSLALQAPYVLNTKGSTFLVFGMLEKGRTQVFSVTTRTTEASPRDAERGKNARQQLLQT